MIDKQCHEIYKFLKNFKPVQKITGTKVHYYYCEERLYLLIFPDGKFALVTAQNPQEALNVFKEADK